MFGKPVKGIPELVRSENLQLIYTNGDLVGRHHLIYLNGGVRETDYRQTQVVFFGKPSVDIQEWGFCGKASSDIPEWGCLGNRLKVYLSWFVRKTSS